MCQQCRGSVTQTLPSPQRPKRQCRVQQPMPGYRVNKSGRPVQRDARETLWMQSLVDMCGKGGDSTPVKVQRILDQRKIKAPFSTIQAVSTHDDWGLTPIGAVLRSHATCPNDLPNRLATLMLLLNAKADITVPFVAVCRRRTMSPLDFCATSGKKMDKFLEVILWHQPALFTDIDVTVERKNLDPLPESIIREANWRRRRWLLKTRSQQWEGPQSAIFERGIHALPDEVFRVMLLYV